MNKYILLFTFLLAVQIVSAQKFSHKNGTFTDPRDGKTYATITFIKQVGEAVIERTWYSENANYETPGSYCYKDEPAYCEKFGRLYNYAGANEACPEGWHVPTITEWNYLFEFFGGRHEAGEHLLEGGESDMHMLYAGFAEPGHKFKDITVSGNWWDNELKEDDAAGIITIIKGSSEIYHSVIGNSHKLSTRCVLKHE